MFQKVHRERTGRISRHAKFLCKAISQGHIFVHALYDNYKPQHRHYHTDISGKLCQDVLMWKQFLQDFTGWMPIIYPAQVKVDKAIFYTDASANPDLGWGSFFPKTKQWSLEHSQSSFSLFQTFN